MMRKYPKVKYPNDEDAKGVFASGDIVIQEKLDGANFRFTLEDNLDEEYHTSERDIVFGSRNVIFKNQSDENKQFERSMEYIRDVVDPKIIREIQEKHNGSLTFFGESMTPHTLEYDWKNTPRFIGFDVYHEDDERWLTQANIERAFDELNLPTTPVIDIVSAKAWGDYSIEVGESAFGDVKAEGFTFKNYDTQTFAKFVRDDFKEKAKKTFGASKKQQKSGAEKLSYTYITNARIEKQAHKLVDEGEYDSLKMEMMKDLPTAVIRDMAEEEAGNIFMDENFEVDLGDFRSETSGRCAQVLKQMIQQRAIEEMN